jgi:hypothetical protein
METNKNIPFSIKKLFWDINKEKLDANLHKKNIIERIINYGALVDWKWLSSVYGKKLVIDTLNSKDKFNRKNIRPSALHLASILFK